MSTTRTRTETTEVELEKDLEKELECSLCRDLFREPKTLRCLHSFCLECLEIYVEKNHSNICLSCPICRTPFQSNANSKLKSGELIANLSTDSFLLNNLNIYNSLKNSIPEQQQEQHQKQQKKKKKQNLVCSDGENEATSYCLDCQNYFCEICSRSHKTMKMSKHHQIIAINEMKEEENQKKLITNSNSNSNNQLYCQIHQNEEIKLFCDDCRLSICPMCVEEHPSHKILILSNVIEIEKQLLMDLINHVKPKEKELREGINKCEEVIKELEINSTTTQNQINELFNKIRIKLDEREQELLNKLDEIEKYKKKELQLQKDELQFGIESIIGSCQMIENSISLSNRSNKNIGRLLSMKSLYESRLNYLINNDWKIEPKCHSLIEFSIDEKDEQLTYSSISNIGILDSNEISIDKCLISKNEKPRMFKDEEFKFEIISYSKEGNEMKKGENGKKFKIQIESESESELNNGNNEENKEREWEIKDLKNGRYEVKMKIKNEGKYLVFVQYNGFDINTSPFQIQVSPKQRNYYEISEPKSRFASKGIIHEDDDDEEEEEVNGDEDEDGNNNKWLSSNGITINSKGNIYASNWAINKIQIFDSEGNIISTFGLRGEENGQFNGPIGIAINSYGNIIVCDSDNNRIQIFDSKGKFISTFGSYGKENGQFDNPYGICVDLNDNIYVCDYYNHRIQIFNSNGGYMTQFEVNKPTSIAIDPQTQSIIVTGDESEAFIF